MTENTLHPEALHLIENMPAERLVPYDVRGLEAVRRAAKQSAPAWVNPGHLVVADQDVPTRHGGVAVRIYRRRDDGISRSVPALVYFHGGGFVLGDLDSHDALCSAICDLSGWTVISVDYRLAPEHRFPAAVDDAKEVSSWILSNSTTLGICPEAVAVGGDSAGGALAVAAAAELRNRPLCFKAMVLLYPVLDLRFETASYREFKSGCLLTRRNMRWFRDQYLEDASQILDANASPALIRDLSAMPPTLLVTAGCDPLRDEGEGFVQRLRDAGVDTMGKRYPGQIHGFAQYLEQLQDANRAIADVADFLSLHDPLITEFA